MQRLIVIPLLLLYVFVSIGIHGVSHFCGDEFMGIALYVGKDEADLNCSTHTCCEEPVPEDKECCSDVQFSVFYESERLAGLTINQFDHKVPADHSIPCNQFGIDELKDNNKNSTPLDEGITSTSIPLYLQHHSLIFYG